MKKIDLKILEQALDRQGRAGTDNYRIWGGGFRQHTSRCSEMTA